MEINGAILCQHITGMRAFDRDRTQSIADIHHRDVTSFWRVQFSGNIIRRAVFSHDHPFIGPQPNNAAVTSLIECIGRCWKISPHHPLDGFGDHRVISLTAQIDFIEQSRIADHHHSF